MRLLLKNAAGQHFFPFLWLLINCVFLKLAFVDVLGSTLSVVCGVQWGWATGLLTKVLGKINIPARGTTFSLPL